MKTICSLIFLLTLTTGFAQTQANKLSDSYGKAAFLALKAIERDNSAPPRDSKATDELLDLADAEASSKNEQAMTVTLRRIFAEHRINNLDHDNVELEYQTHAILGHFNADEYKNDPQLNAIFKRESACFTPLENVLRSRSSELPKACESLLAVKTDTEHMSAKPTAAKQSANEQPQAKGCVQTSTGACAK